jgi:DNA-binding response OmpR family regulator
MSGTGKVLVIDDDEDTTFLLSLQLERAGFDVRAVATLKAGQALIPEVSMIVSDRQLLDEDGLDLFEAGRPQNVRYAILVTGDDISDHRAKEAGFDAVERKPIDVRQLIADLHSL